MAPALVAMFVVKNGNGVGGSTVLEQLIQRMLTGGQTRRALYRMNASYQVERVDNQ
ncbi:hypothetical protein DZJ_13730 [Dickeya ananatis]